MYKYIVRSLIYLTLTRPNIIFAIGIASHFMKNLKKSHLKAVKRILRYILEEHLISSYFTKVKLTANLKVIMMLIMLVIMIQEDQP